MQKGSSLYGIAARYFITELSQIAVEGDGESSLSFSSTGYNDDLSLASMPNTNHATNTTPLSEASTNISSCQRGPHEDQSSVQQPCRPTRSSPTSCTPSDNDLPVESGTEQAKEQEKSLTEQVTKQEQSSFDTSFIAIVYVDFYDTHLPRFRRKVLVHFVVIGILLSVIGIVVAMLLMTGASFSK